MEKDPILKTFRDAIRDRKSRAKLLIARLGLYYAQHHNDFAVRKLSVDGRPFGHTEGYVHIRI